MGYVIKIEHPVVGTGYVVVQDDYDQFEFVRLLDEQNKSKFVSESYIEKYRSEHSHLINGYPARSWHDRRLTGIPWVISVQSSSQSETIGLFTLESSDLTDLLLEENGKLYTSDGNRDSVRQMRSRYLGDMVQEFYIKMRIRLSPPNKWVSS